MTVNPRGDSHFKFESLIMRNGVSHYYFIPYFFAFHSATSFSVSVTC
jgi:hypothetical protein